MTESAVRPCSIVGALEVIGDRWSLLVLRELVFGNNRFNGMVAATGAPRDMLTRRLRSLEADELIRRRPYQDRPLRHEYELTASGRRAGDVLLALMAFGDGLSRSRPPVTWHHDDHVLEPVVTCAHCGQPARQDMHDPVGPGAVPPRQ